MSSNDDTIESDEHEEDQEQIDDQVESEGEHDEENDISDQEESHQENHQHDDDDGDDDNNDDEEYENNSLVKEEPDSADAVDPTNPLDEDSVEAAQNLTQEDIFGEELSEDEDGGRRKNQVGNDFSGDQEGNESDNDKLNEEEEEEEQIIVDTPYVSCDLGRDIHLVKLPSFMTIEPKPFDAQYFNEEIHDEDDEESKARKKMALENTIRWRYNSNENGETIRESNTRLVRWSDGSLSLHVGKEIFDVSKTNIQSDHNHLFVRHQKSMQAQAVFRTKLSFRQHSNDSLAHLKLKFASKANPAPKVRVLSNIKEASNSADMKKKEEQRIKAERRRINQQLRQSERATDKDQKISEGYLEDRYEDDEENEQESLNAIKKHVKKKRLQGGYQAEGTSEDDDDDDDPSEKLISQRSSTSMKHRKITSSDEDESSNEQQTKRTRVQSADDDDDEEQQSN